MLKILKNFFFKMIRLVMGRAWNFRASGRGGLGLLCIWPRAGRAFMYRASGFIRAFLKYEIYLNYRKKRPSIFFKIFFLFFVQCSAGISVRIPARIRPHFSHGQSPNLNRKMPQKCPIFCPNWAENRPILGPKKPAGLSGFEDRASGGLGPPKNRLGRAGFGLSPRPDPSLDQVIK